MMRTSRGGGYHHLQGSGPFSKSRDKTRQHRRTTAGIKLRAERMVGGSIEKLLASLPKALRRTDTGDKIAGATADVKFRAERRFGRRAKAWPHNGSLRLVDSRSIQICFFTARARFAAELRRSRL
jgi:hypothetical protein